MKWETIRLGNKLKATASVVRNMVPELFLESQKLIKNEELSCKNSGP